MKNDKTREVGMFKLIWKNLWARRRKNGWLLAELILVSIISWVVLDPVIVVTHDRNIPCQLYMYFEQPKRERK